MKRKVLVVLCVMWAACVLGGGVWERFERYLETRSIPPGQLEAQHLKDMYQAKLFNEILKECDRAESDTRNAGYEPQIMYVRWATDQQLGRIDDADDVQNSFLRRFPDHVLAADMHFNTAMNLLALRHYTETERELAFIHTHCPDAPVATRADKILGRLRGSSSTASTATKGWNTEH